jgi:predicted CopG family antitoxin
MPKTITISDEVYAKLLSIKGKRSFSEVIKDLIEKKAIQSFS